jgi:ABC-type uncharacterized transport system permease subunit
MREGDIDALARCSLILTILSGVGFWEVGWPVAFGLIVGMTVGTAFSFFMIWLCEPPDPRGKP